MMQESGGQTPVVETEPNSRSPADGFALGRNASPSSALPGIREKCMGKSWQGRFMVAGL